MIATPPLPDAILPPDLLLLAYRDGIFPMADSRDDADVFWVEPRRRAILPLDGFHLSHSLAKVIRRDSFIIRCNHDFSGVIQRCATIARKRDSDGEAGCWISKRIEASYIELHRRGIAHSIECWQPGPNGTETLAGGLYGVGFDGVFCGESMFSAARDASKVALAALVAAMKTAGMRLLDCQFITPHLASLGAVEISREEYRQRLAEAQRPFSLLSARSGVADGRAVGRTEGRAEGLADARGDGRDEGLADAEGLALGRGLGLPLALGVGDGFLSVAEGFALLLGDGRGDGLADGVPEATGVALAGDAVGRSSSSPGYRITQSLTQTS